jgi:hypothetical protein
VRVATTQLHNTLVLTHAADFATHLPSPPPGVAGAALPSAPQAELFFLLGRPSKGSYLLPPCFLAVFKEPRDSEAALFEGAHPKSPSRPHNVLQVLPISLLGDVVGLVCHNAHKQQVLPMARIKCSSKVKTKRRSSAAPFWAHFEPRSGPIFRLVCNRYSSAAGGFFLSRGFSAVMLMTKS